MVKKKIVKTVKDEIGNTKSNLVRHWAGTIDYKSIEGTDDEKIAKILELCKPFCRYIRFQFEIGSKTGYKHYQTYFHAKERGVSFNFLKELFPTGHFEKCKKKVNWINYVSKDFTREGLPVEWSEEDHKYDHIKIPKKEELFKWQLDILNIIKNEPHDRFVYWYYDKKGGTGKSTFATYLIVKHKALVVSGKKNDILYAVAEAKETNLIIIDIPRTLQDYISYEAIENVKNGTFFSGKYESKMIVRNRPHVICFANFPPNIMSMSLDRWQIIKIDALECRPFYMQLTETEESEIQLIL